MARPSTIFTLLEKGPRYVELPQIAQYGTAERVSDATDAAHGTKEAFVFITASFGGTTITNLYGFKAPVAIDPEAAKKDKELLKAASEEAIAPLRGKAEDLLRSFQNFLHSGQFDDSTPSLITLDWFIESGRYAEYAAPDRDVLPKLPPKGGNLN